MPNRPLRIYVQMNLAPAAREALVRGTLGDEVHFARPQGADDGDRAYWRGCDVAFGGFPEDRLHEAASLRWIQFASVGVDSVNHLDWERLGSRVVCTNLGSVLAEPMAQSVLAGLLALHRCIDQLVLLQARRDWQKARIHPQMAVLCGHVLLLGGGAVNRRLRELLGVFGCTFTVYARNTGDIRTPAELDEVLPRADLVCAALPDTPQTRGLLDRSRLARFKRGALLANVGRGSLVDELALVDALKGHALGGAVLDVTCEEPLPASSPLWNCPRLLLTQHTAAGSRDVHLDVVKVFLANLARYRRGEPLFHPIDWSKGY